MLILNKYIQYINNLSFFNNKIKSIKTELIG